MFVILSSVAGLIGIGLATRGLWRMGSRQQKRSLPDPAVREELQRLQTAVDAIAIEVERISEAQRFTVTLLSKGVPAGGDRLGELPRRGTASRDTPH